VTEAGAAEDPEFVWPILADSYSAIEESWRELLATGLGDSTRRQDHEIPENSPRSSVLAVGYMSGMMAATAIGGRLDLLSRAYWPPRTRHDFTPVDQLAVYPPARAVLEAAAIVCWALDGNLDTRARLLRAAELWLWSAADSRTNDPAKAVADIKAAGITVVLPRNGKGKPALSANGQRRPQLTISQMVRSMFGDFGIAMYGVWSSASHSDPFHIFDALEELSQDDGTIRLGFKVDPVYHLLTAAWSLTRSSGPRSAMGHSLAGTLLRSRRTAIA
jgi:hypothetical protein